MPTVPSCESSLMFSHTITRIHLTVPSALSSLFSLHLTPGSRILVQIMISMVHILGWLWPRDVWSIRIIKRCSVKSLHKCFSRHQMEGSFPVLYFPYGKVSRTWKGNTLRRGILLTKELYKECSSIGFSCVIYSLGQITLKAQTASWI